MPASPSENPAPDPVLRPRKAPRQRRSRDTVATILEAAARVLATESLAGFNTNRVAEVAGISVGSLYQYFPNKTALVAALIDQAQRQLGDRLEAAVADLAGVDLASSIDRLAELAVAQQYEQPLLAAALDHEERRLPLEARLSESAVRIVAAVQQLLDRHASMLPADLPQAAARDCLAIAKALVESEVHGARSAPPDLVQRVARALRGYLGLPLTPAPRVPPCETRPPPGTTARPVA